MDKFLSRWEKQTDNKHGKNFHEKRKHFSLFVLSVDGMLGKEDLAVLVNFSQLVADNSSNLFHMYMVGSTTGSQSRL